LLITAALVPGLQIAGIVPAIIGAAVMGLVNAIVKPILIIFTLPLTILTLGLFLLVVNAIGFASGRRPIAFGLVGYLTPGFTVSGFFPALIGTIVLAIISSLLNGLFEREFPSR